MIFVVFDLCFRLIVWQILLRGTCGIMSANVKLKREGNADFLRRIPVIFTEEHKAKILKMHNDYRSTAEPPASDMRLMTWDEEAEKSAQLWARNCIFEHGMPPQYNNIPMGQNLYIGGDKTGAEATFLWWNETHDYNFWTDTCKPDVPCGHYTQMLWGTSDRLGCGISACPEWNLIVCHYLPPGNYKHEKPYIAGKPCSQCNTTSGGRCYQNLCVKDEECETLGLQCSCPLQCHNCGVLDKKNCRCQCKDGWDSLDCSKRCEDEHHYCGKNPGFPTFASCSRDPRIKNNFCRSMCGQCNATPSGYPKLFFDPDVTGESGKKLDLCCSGVTCPEGYVLDEDYCECSKLCPGPLCGNGSQIQFMLFILLLPIISLGV